VGQLHTFLFEKEALHAKAALPPTRRSCATADSTLILCTPGVCVSNTVSCRLLPARAPKAIQYSFLREFRVKRGTFAYLIYGASASFALPDHSGGTTAVTTMSLYCFPMQLQIIPYTGPPKPKPTSRRNISKTPFNEHKYLFLDEELSISLTPTSHQAGDFDSTLSRHSQS
jgi:hypothetical protein